MTLYDNVRAQHALVTQGLGIARVRAVVGWSMGAAQTYQWATQYPEMMDVAVPFCGAARCALHNQVFLEGQKSALLAAKGQYSAGSKQDRVLSSGETWKTWTEKEKDVGLRAFGRGYAGWGLSQAFYREKVYESLLGYEGLEEFLVGFWEEWAVSKGTRSMAWLWE